MNVRRTIGIICMLLLSLILQQAYGETDGREIEQNLYGLTPDNARGYLMPFMESYAASTLRSTYHTAEIDRGFNLYIGMKAMVAFIPDANKTFTAIPPNGQSPTRTATVVGDEGNEIFPNGFNWSFVPIMIPQLQISSFFGTEFTLRYLPATKFDDKIGDFNIFGGGITHSISQYLPKFPVQFSVQGFYQLTKLGDVFESTAASYNFIASTRFSGMTIYGGLGYEHTDIDVEYMYAPPPDLASSTPPGMISFSESFEDRFRATFGMSLQFIIFNINADYSLGEYDVATVGLGISI